MRAILTYHSLDESGSPISLSPRTFRQHVEWFASGRVRVVGVRDLLELTDAEDAVALTFDDGFANFASDAMPLLAEHRLPATVFIVTSRVGRDNRWRGLGDPGVPELPLLDWDAIGRLREAGITFGAHSKTHPRLPTLPSPELEEEVHAASADMERYLGGRPEGFCYPYGAVNQRVASVAGKFYAWACTTEFRPIGSRESLTILPRLDAWYFQSPGRFAQWGTPGFSAWIWTRRQGRRARSLTRRLGAS